MEASLVISLAIVSGVVLVIYWVWDRLSVCEDCETTEDFRGPDPEVEKEKPVVKKKKRKEVKKPNKKERAKVYKRVQKVYKKRGYTMTMRETEDFFDEYLLILGVIWLASLPRGDEAFYEDMNDNVDVSEYGSEMDASDWDPSYDGGSDGSNDNDSSDSGSSGGDD